MFFFSKFTCFGLMSRLSKLEELLVLGTPVVISLFSACEHFGNSLLKNSDFFSLLKAAVNKHFIQKITTI